MESEASEAFGEDMALDSEGEGEGNEGIDVGASPHGAGSKSKSPVDNVAASKLAASDAAQPQAPSQSRQTAHVQDERSVPSAGTDGVREVLAGTQGLAPPRRSSHGRSSPAPGAQGIVPPPRSPRSVHPPPRGGGPTETSLASPRAGGMDAQGVAASDNVRQHTASDNILAGKAFGWGNVPVPGSPRGGGLGMWGERGGQKRLVHEKFLYEAFVCSSALDHLAALPSSQERAGAATPEAATAQGAGIPQGDAIGIPQATAIATPQATASAAASAVASAVRSPGVSHGISAVSHAPLEAYVPPGHSRVERSRIHFSRRNEDGGRARSGFSICGLA